MLLISESGLGYTDRQTGKHTELGETRKERKFLFRLPLYLLFTLQATSGDTVPSDGPISLKGQKVH